MPNMSGLPDTIQVKRKLGQDGVVDFLRFEEYTSKRRKGQSAADDEAWVYQRTEAGAGKESAKKPLIRPRRHGGREGEAGVRELAAPPVIQVSRPGDENRPIKPLRQKKSVADARTPSPPSSPAPAPLSDASHNVRRFYLSRAPEPQLLRGVLNSRISKKRSSVFVERDSGRKKPKTPSERLPLEKLGITESEGKPAAPAPGSNFPTGTLGQAISLPVRNRRPGKGARTTQPKPALPPSLINRQNVDMDRLARDMDAYTLEQISYNLAKVEQEKKQEQARDQKPQFRPKGQGPGQRFFERNPDYASEYEQARTAKAGPGISADVDTEDESYIVETYVRVPASRLTAVVPPHQIGLLVFDTEPDRLEFFYGNEVDSDEEVDMDDEDENAEDYYTADYPDEDLPWDDELDENPYHYMTQNASDLEEFDEDAYYDQVSNELSERMQRMGNEDASLAANPDYAPGLFK